MAMYNILKVRIACPNCGNVSSMEAEFRFGFLNLDEYQLGDQLHWDNQGGGLRYPKHRPQGGNYIGDAYVECPVCHNDFWLIIKVEKDVLKSADIDYSRKGFFNDHNM